MRRLSFYTVRRLSFYTPFDPSSPDGDDLAYSVVASDPALCSMDVLVDEARHALGVGTGLAAGSGTITITATDLRGRAYAGVESPNGRSMLGNIGGLTMALTTRQPESHALQGVQRGSRGFTTHYHLTS